MDGMLVSDESCSVICNGGSAKTCTTSISLTEEIKNLILAKEQDEEVFSKLIERQSGYETLITEFDRRMHLIEKSNAGAKLEPTK